MPEEVRKQLQKIYEGAHEPSEHGYADKKAEFVFHMLDWKDDLDELANAYSNAESMSDEAFEKAVTSFLYHAAPHIVEAAKLYDYLPKPFGAERESASKS